MLICASLANEYGGRADAARLDGWLARLAQGDGAALGALYEATNAAVFALALSILKNFHDAEDVLHDCYLTLYAAAADYRSGGKPMAWIMTVARNLCLRRLRERKRTAELPPEDLEAYLTHREDLCTEDRLIITQCMTRLSDEERQIIVLHAVAGFRHREIAQMLELPLPTVLSKYHRALKKLREHLTKGERAI